MKKYSIQDFLEIKSSSSPSFSPDGSMILFLNNLTGTVQVYIVPIKGGDAEQVTFFTDPISFASFSPTRNEILFGKAENGNENTQLYLYSLDTKQIKKITSKPNIQHNFGGWSRDGVYITYSSNERDGTDFDIFVMNIDTEEIECVYNEGGYCEALGFSPDRTYLALSKRQSNVNNDLYLINLNSKEIQHITPHEGNVFYGSPQWMPDELIFYVVTNRSGDFFALELYNLKKHTFDSVITPDWDVDGVSISEDGNYFNVVINEDGYEKSSLYNTQNREKIIQKHFPKDLIYSATFSHDSKYLALCAGSPRHPTDIWIWSIEEDRCWQLTKSPQRVPSEELVDPELIRYISFDGVKIPAFLYRPRETKGTNKIPVIVYMHGGPESQISAGCAGIHLLFQYFLYHGYAVIAPNVRGSTGYGKKYMALDDVEKRLDSVRDLASLHEYLTTIPFIDSKKVVLMGGSYGGYMTLAGLAFYPELWAAGVDIVGIANLVTFLENTASYRRGLRECEYGYLDKHRDLLYAISPINHAEKIKAPLLVIHGANDPRVPLSEAKQIVEKLTTLHREADLLVYHDEGHGLSKLKNRLDAYPKVIKFIEKSLS